MQDKNWINLVFVIDKSGSMYHSKDDVTGGFNKVIEEQKAIKEGKVTVSLFTFDSEVNKLYVGKDINDIPEFKYEPFGMTAMNDGIGTAIDTVGNWLHDKDKAGEDMPAKTLVVVMTDGLENSSKEYTLNQVKDKIKEQTDKYSWEFIYMGMDITTTKDADDLGFKFKTYSSKKNLSNNYNIINSATTAYRSMAASDASLATMDMCLSEMLAEETKKNTEAYEKEIGRKLANT